MYNGAVSPQNYDSLPGHPRVDQLHIFTIWRFRPANPYLSYDKPRRTQCQNPVCSPLLHRVPSYISAIQNRWRYRVVTMLHLADFFLISVRVVLHFDSPFEASTMHPREHWLLLLGLLTHVGLQDNTSRFPLECTSDLRDPPIGSLIRTGTFFQLAGVWCAGEWRATF